MFLKDPGGFAEVNVASKSYERAFLGLEKG